MKITQLLDRPIAYHRCFVNLTGSVKAAVMLSQAVYWQPRAKQADGWWYKTAEEWQEETGLTEHEQRTARKDCSKYLLSDLRGIPAQLFWKVDETALEKDLLGENSQTSLAESAKLVVEEARNINKNTENTAETTYTVDIPLAVEQANKSVDAMLDQEQKAVGKMTYSKRESLPESIRELIDEFVRVSGIKPIAKDVFGWLQAGNDWLEIGVQVKDILPAYRLATDKYSVYSPHSITKELQSLKAKATTTTDQPAQEGNGFYG